jgi:hypothetical protein
MVDKRYSTDHEQRLRPSPSKPFRRPPTCGSYSPDGRGNIFHEGARQIPNDVGNTGSSRKKPTWPGRW